MMPEKRSVLAKAYACSNTSGEMKILLSVLLLLVALTAILTAVLVAAAGHGDRVGQAALVLDPDSGQLTGVEGEPFNVSCEGTGGHCSHFSAMQWTAPDGSLISDERGNPRTLRIDARLYLVFSNPKLKDSGSYRCSALYDRTRELEQRVYVEFYAQERIRGRKPKFLSSSYNVSVAQGLIVKLHCSAQSKLPLTYDWFNQAGDKIFTDSRKRIFVSNSSAGSVLTINGARPEADEGQYICMAKNLNGLDTKFYFLQVIVNDGDASGVRMVTRPGGHYVRGVQGQPVNVSCEPAGGDRSKFSRPKWTTVDGLEVPEEGDPSVLKSDRRAVLTFMEPRINDSASFFCSAVFEDEVELQYEVFLEIDGNKPEFPVYSEDIVADAGGWLRVSCKAQGELPITYSWYNQNADKITESTNSTIYATHSGDESYLTFSDVSSEDRGTYTCSAMNSYGQVNKYYALRVLNATGMKPEFHVSFENLTGVAGKQLEMQCLAMGERPITYDWYNQEEDKIPEDDRSSVHAISGDKYSVLSFQRLSLAHQGAYTCTASNEHGLVSKVFMLSVA